MNEAPMVDDSLESKKISINEIPIVDIAPLVDGSNPKYVADQFRQILESIGFLYIKNHGIDKNLMAAIYRLTKEFFALPQSEKNKLHISHSGQTLRGYIPIYGENVDPKYTKDFKECFDYGQHGGEVSPFFGPNLMPDDPKFKKAFESYHDQMLVLARQLVSAVALSLDLPQDYFASRQQKPITIQRLLHYPSQEGEITREEIGAGAHTDYGFLTILSQDENGGLQVKNRLGEWISAPPIADTFVVNIGDLVQTLTNDKYISTLHRVVNTSGRDRYSIPFFIDMDFDAVVEVVPTCQSKEHPPKYQPYTCGQHKYGRFVDSYEHLQELKQ